MDSLEPFFHTESRIELCLCRRGIRCSSSDAILLRYGPMDSLEPFFHPESQTEMFFCCRGQAFGAPTVAPFSSVNLDGKVDERMLYEIMVQAGPLVSLSIPKIKNFNVHRGYGFAEYTTAESVEYAVKLFSGLVSLYGKRLGFKIAGTKNNWAPVINQEAHGLSHKYQFTPPTLKSCVGYCMPFILLEPHSAAHEQKVSSGHLAQSTQVTKAKRKSRFKSKTSARTAINHFVNDKQPKPKRWDTDRHFVNDNEPKPKGWDTDRRNSSEAIEIQRISS